MGGVHRAAKVSGGLVAYAVWTENVRPAPNHRLYEMRLAATRGSDKRQGVEIAAMTDALGRLRRGGNFRRRRGMQRIERRGQQSVFRTDNEPRQSD